MGRAQGGVAQRGVLGVIMGHDQDVGAARQLLEHLLGQQRRVMHVHLRHRVCQHGEASLGEDVGAGVDQMQVEVLTCQDAREFEPDVPDAEDRHGPYHGSGSSSTVTVPPQHCTPCWLVTLSFRAKSINSGSGLATSIISLARSIATASTLPPPIEPQVSVSPTTSFARRRAARGRARSRRSQARRTPGVPATARPRRPRSCQAPLSASAAVRILPSAASPLAASPLPA